MVQHPTAADVVEQPHIEPWQIEKRVVDPVDVGEAPDSRAFPGDTNASLAQVQMHDSRVGVL